MTFQTRRIREEAPLRTSNSKSKPAKPKKEKISSSPRRALFLKRALLILVASFFIVVIVGGVFKTLVSLRILTISTFINATAADLPADKNGFTNFLLLGRGDKDHDGIDLTDTVMVASMDPNKTESTVLLSLPRDLYIMESEKMGKGRLNELYRNYKSELRRTEKMSENDASKAALKELMKELGSKLDIELHHAVIVDFSALVKSVDTLNGLPITVPYDIVDPEYPGPDYTYETFQISAGPTILDGETALKYVRSRHTTSDFGRSARQQQIIQALAEKAKSEGLIGSPRKIMSFLSILSEHVEMTMTTPELLGAAKIAEAVDRSRVITMQLNNANGLYGEPSAPGGLLYNPPRDLFAGASVLLPVSIPEFPVTWKQIRVLVRLMLENRDQYLNRPSIAILNAGGKTGLARRLANELLRFGFNVDLVDNAGGAKQNPSIVSALTPADKDSAKFISGLLQIQIGTSAAVPEESKRQVTILLGKEYSFVPIQDLLVQQ